MTPGARLAAAAAILDQVLAGAPAERALTNWARASRYAGSKDRAAVRDLVFDALRRRRSLAWVGGSESGRGLMIGRLRAAGIEPTSEMTGEGHALAPPAEDERTRPLDTAPLGVRLDMPDWLLPRLAASLGSDLEPVCLTLTGRAPATLRVNLRKTDRESARAALASKGITAEPDPEVATALHLVGSPRITATDLFLKGLVELQDASSQEAVLRLPLRAGDRVLDLCAGGGGKTLAMAGRADLHLVAHDAEPRRMVDLPARADRTGIVVDLVPRPEDLAPFDLVYVDAPCSGSGTWRRTPDAKWRLTEARLQDLMAIQDDVLDRAATLVGPAGHIAFATCSILSDEGDDRVAAFLRRHDGWAVVDRMLRLPDDLGDGFFQTVLRRSDRHTDVAAAVFQKLTEC